MSRVSTTATSGLRVRAMLRTAAALALTTTTMLSAAACAPVAGAPSVSVSPTNTNANTAEPTPTTPATMTPDEALAAFRTIAKYSSARADRLGLTQTTDNSKYGVYTLVLDRNYNADYQAAVKNADGTIELIYEADAFAPAGALGALDLGALVRFENGEYVMTQQIENDPYEYRYTVVDGLITAESGKSGGASWKSKLQYSVTDEGHAILEAAIKSLSN